MQTEEIKKLKQHANNIRKNIIAMLTKAKSGHTAGSLGMADIFTYLYFKALKHKPEDPNWEERDRLILSNGHICPVLYATMAESGYFLENELMTLRELGSRLQGHPHREFLPGIETSSGPLGEGLSQGVGMAIADRINNNEKYFYCLLGDGELNEGNIWEAAMHAGKEKLSNLIVIVDRNNIQLDGFTRDVMPLEPLFDKWNSFGFFVQEINGHDFKQIHNSINLAKSQNEKPSVIIANIVPGKGVAEFENKPEWHGKAPNEEQAGKALSELSKNDEHVE